MALQGRFEYRGVHMDRAYLRIDEIYGGKTIGMQGRAKLYFSKETAQAPGTVNALTIFEVALTPQEWKPDDNPFPLLYEKLKQQQQLINFIDA